MVNRNNPFAKLIIMLCFIFLLSACTSNTSNNNESSSRSSTEEQEPSQADESRNRAFPRTIHAANGEITIEKEPKKVAVVHWGYLDSLLLFDLQSVAVAFPFTEKQSAIHTESYQPYVEKLDEFVTIGENELVNLEALLAYEPDLIIAGNAINKDITAELSRIATTVVIDEEETNVWGDWQSLVTQFGEILAQEDVAETYIAHYRSQIDSAKEKLAGLKGTVAFVQVRENMMWLQGTDYVSQYYEGLGLEAPITDTMKEGEQLSLEGLITLDPDHLFLGYFNYTDRTLPAVTDEWEKSEVWKRLKSVQNNHVYPINGELALGFGPIGHSYGIQAVLEALEPATQK